MYKPVIEPKAKPMKSLTPQSQPKMLSDTRQEMNLAHHRPDQALDMPAIVRLTGWTPNDVDPFVSTAVNEGLAPEIGPVVDVH